MLKKIKDILGIEGVKIALQVPEELDIDSGLLSGKIIMNSQSEKTVSNISLKLIEKYRRGRKDAKLINEYLLGSIDIELNLTIKPNEEEVLKFDLPFNLMKSEMDQLEDNLVFKPFIKLAKKFKNVKSEYKVTATATIKGTRLDAIAESKIKLV